MTTRHWWEIEDEIKEKCDGRANQEGHYMCSVSQWIHTTKDFEGSCCGTGQGHTIISWNVRGLNELGRNKEINSLLPSLKPDIIILIDTRVK